jgi:putative pyruvate formate lyase activating enzyme
MVPYPSYLESYRVGKLDARIEALYKILSNCTLCPRRCKKNRSADERGTCGAGGELTISSAFPHFGEEPELTGSLGSGTIFLTHCNLRCLFCQNYDISHGGSGETIDIPRLAELMIGLQNAGCHNINFVTPTHFAPHLVDGIRHAIGLGFELPVVWNCGGYESLEVLKLLEGIVDIYMPDIKFFDTDSAKLYCNAPDYPARVREVLTEMHRQVGPLETDDRGIARRGLLVRHLVMPNHENDTKDILDFICNEISPATYINIMSQYRPAYRAMEFDKISRPVGTEYSAAVAYAKKIGLSRGF